MLRAMKRTIKSLIFALAAAAFMPVAAQAQSAPSIIRDTEIENTIKDWTAPVIRAAGLSPDSVHFIIVQDSNVNAFVAGGPNIFIYTGLLQKSKSPDEIAGVVAHELRLAVHGVGCLPKPHRLVHPSAVQVRANAALAVVDEAMDVFVWRRPVESA